MASLSVVSLMAMVPDNECRMPTLMVSAARAPVTPPRVRASASSANIFFNIASSWEHGVYAPGPHGTRCVVAFG